MTLDNGTQYCYAEYHYDECRYVECRGALYWKIRMTSICAMLPKVAKASIKAKLYILYLKNFSNVNEPLDAILIFSFYSLNPN